MGIAKRNSIKRPEAKGFHHVKKPRSIRVFFFVPTALITLILWE